MKRSLIFILLCLTALGLGQETYLGLYLQGNKLGYSSYLSTNAKLNGKSVKRNDSNTVINAALLGSAMTMQVKTTTWADAKGQPVRMRFVTTSGGRTQVVDAAFSGSRIQINIDNNGTKTKKTLTIPKGASVVDDPLTPIMLDGARPGAKKSFYILDPTTISLIKNDLVVHGQEKVTVKKKTVTATKVEVIDPRANTTIYVSSKGDFIKAIGPMGMEIYPETKAEALGKSTGFSPSLDLAVVTSIETDKPLEDPSNLGFLKIRISGKDLKSLPNDGFQTAAGSGTSWVLTIHPPKLSDSEGQSISEAAAKQEKWTKPSDYIPSDAPQFKKLAEQIVAGETNVKKAALKIKDYVQKSMRPNAGIGVLRNATEILKTKEGVCRDYAILTATLLRATGIPTKVVSGLVNWDGSFYYHAWVEAWDGERWIGLDSTTPDPQISAAHVKLNDGNVEEAFTFLLLDGVKVEVLEARRW